MKGKSPTARTLAWCKTNGYTAGIVERRNPKLRFKTHDFLGVIDLIACAPAIGIVGVQATSGAHHAARMAKIEMEPRALVWLASGARLEVHSWRKGGARGERKTWLLRRTRAFLSGDKIGWSEEGA